MWQQSAGQGRATIAADGFGGLLVQTAQGSTGTLMDLDAQTGSIVWQQPFGSNIGSITDFSMRPNGDFVVYGSTGVTDPSTTWMFSGATGQGQRLPFYVGTTVSACSTETSPGGGGGPAGSITSDSLGNTYIAYQLSNVTEVGDYCSSPTTWTTTNDTSVRLMTIDSSGAVTDELVKEDKSTMVCTTLNGGQTLQYTGMSLQSGIVNPDGQGGALVTWSHYPVTWTNLACWQNSSPPTNIPTEVSDISSNGSAQYELPLNAGGANGQLVLGESGNAFMGTGAQVLAFNTSTGQINWSYAGGGNILAATDDGGVALMGGSPLNITEVDSTGTPQLITNYPTASCAPTISWQGAWLNCQDQSPTAIALPLAADPASLWPTTGGTPSANNNGHALCNCDVESSPAPTDDSCPICQIQPSQGTAPNCSTFAGTGNTYILLVGDPGTIGPRGIDHDVGGNFALSAQTAANSLVGLGYNVVACRVSTVEQFTAALEQNGYITGGAQYFGHSGVSGWTDAAGHHLASEVYVGQGTDPDTNITASNVRILTDVQKSNNGQNNFGPNASAILYGCEAGAPVQDYYAGYATSIAQLISTALVRGVYAYVGFAHFSNSDAVHDLTNWGEGTDPTGLPMYMNADGKPPRPKLHPFCPGGACPQN